MRGRCGGAAAALLPEGRRVWLLYYRMRFLVVLALHIPSAGAAAACCLPAVNLAAPAAATDCLLPVGCCCCCCWRRWQLGAGASSSTAPLQGGSHSTSCVLCPVSRGAFKQAVEGGQWVHCVCALWHNETRLLPGGGELLLLLLLVVMVVLALLLSSHDDDVMAMVMVLETVLLVICWWRCCCHVALIILNPACITNI